MIWDFIAGPRYTNDELNARLRFIIGLILGLTLFGIVFVVLYSLIFVTQPMNGMSPVDNKFFELIIPIATFLTGTLSGIMLAGDDKDLRQKALESANKPPPPSPPPMTGPGFGTGNMRSALGRFGQNGTAPIMGGAAAGMMMGGIMGAAMSDEEFLPGQSPKFTDDD